MVSWQAFEEEAAGLAAVVKARFTAAETHVLATLRADGSPRVSGSEVDFRGPDLFVGSMLDAVKARDLRRDGRCAIHAHPSDVTGEDGGDAKLAGVAVEVTDPEEVRRLQGHDMPSHLFRLDLTEVVLTSVEGNALVIRRWRPGQEPVRLERPDNGPVVRVGYR
ncbi:pyridoxamine 5'-phosphate oxidase family protein [Amycolatopsis suaedae]|uniref:Pyridoxamine 5'-phosphate oxidase family protein n=1 Tax=Amycolatopsis suaedae TaxID=2510978 RepID=A0A4Q7J680_9PSEU|nr:pyridoxamine 5'-phosphate oxidase family protein [Amycolatopsis suaedae]RZQ63120.1 pyridoxamine 5'-phosphate oxidase family protein [Amycolatopsis suaedae]